MAHELNPELLDPTVEGILADDDLHGGGGGGGAAAEVACRGVRGARGGDCVRGAGLRGS